ncbi:MAG: hypothetical protein DI603_20730 [Roseateles depolymerans]|uniref:Uncharacterized protein n=1 Tax=Roseateles depolymerans TaxID=76731 RepID=A0A2W5D817_9BURK|nr:MAG: hypothetical protein DI603_20730 [Roseateles depolymerans]
MHELNLGEQALVAPRAWWASALATAAALVKVWAAVALGLSVGLAAVVSVLALGALVLARGLRRRAGLDLGSRCLTRRLRLFGWPVHSRRQDLSDVAWVRVRELGTEDLWLVEAGTSGYRTFELQRLPRSAADALAQAQALGARVAEGLGVVDKGHRSLAGRRSSNDHE